MRRKPTLYNTFFPNHIFMSYSHRDKAVIGHVMDIGKGTLKDNLIRKYLTKGYSV